MEPFSPQQFAAYPKKSACIRLKLTGSTLLGGSGRGKSRRRGAGLRSLVLEADWYSLSISSLPQPKVDFVNIWVIIGSVLGESVNCYTNLVFCQKKCAFVKWQGKIVHLKMRFDVCCCGERSKKVEYVDPGASGPLKWWKSDFLGRVNVRGLYSMRVKFI